MLSIPTFKLHRERPAVLWFGLIFFLLLALLCFVHGTLPLFPHKKKPTQETPKELQNLDVPKFTLQNLSKMTAQHSPQKPQKMSIKELSSIFTAIGLFFWPIIPIAKEILHRKKRFSKKNENNFTVLKQ